MRRKLTAMFVAVLLIAIMMPNTVLAGNATISSGGTYDLATYGNSSTITIATTAAVTLTHSNSSTALTDFQIVCNDGSNLTINGININNSLNDDRCALSFTGVRNNLTVAGTNTLISGKKESGIRVEDATDLTISGNGTSNLNVTGGYYCAGIGCGPNSNCGTITIKNGTVTATGGMLGAGIGSGSNGNGGTIIIENGTITAIGGSGSAGIGGGARTSGGTIIIENGTITATGGLQGAGIGGGTFGDGGSITIKNGTVTATGGYSSAGIGGANGGSGGAINILGGTVFAQSGNSSSMDIGGSGGSLGIFGEAVVFLRNDSCISPTTNLTYFGFKYASGGKIYGTTMPSGWYRASLYSSEYSVTYDSNGGLGIHKTTNTPKRATTTILNSSGFSKAGYNFLQWNTQSTGNGTIYNTGDSIVLTSDLSLYAIWEEITVTGVTISDSSITLSPNEMFVLSASVTPTNAADTNLTWASDNTSVATVDSKGVITAVSAGSANIAATSNSESDVCIVTVTQPATKVSLSSSSESLNIGDVISLTATVSPDSTSYTKVIWESTNTNVVSVVNGQVTAKDKGVASIIATVGGVSDVCTISVNTTDVASVTLSSTSQDLKIGESITLEATIKPSDADSPYISWRSTDSTIAKVNSTGEITAVAKGSATIIATADGVSAVCTVTVRENEVTKITLSSEVEMMNIGDVITLSAEITPSDAKEQNITWISSNTNVATVDKDGNVTAKGYGYASIIATSGGAISACTTNVTAKDSNAVISEVDEDNNSTTTEEITEESTSVPIQVEEQNTQKSKSKLFWIMLIGSIIGMIGIFAGRLIYNYFAKAK